MAHNVHVSTAVRNAMLNAFTVLLNSGYIDILDGAQPANANVAVSTQHVLVTLTYGATAFAAASGGSVTANAIGSGVIGTSGTAAWARMYESDHTTAVTDCSVDIAGNTPDITVPTTTFTVGVTVTMSSSTVSMAA